MKPNTPITYNLIEFHKPEHTAYGYSYNLLND